MEPSEDQIFADKMQDQIDASSIPELYKLLKSDELTRHDIGLIETKALPEGVDLEDENVQKMVGAISAARARCLERENALAEFMYKEQIEAAKTYLKEQGVPGSDLLPENVLYEIAQGLTNNDIIDAQCAPENAEYVQVITQDDDINALVTPSGEVIGFLDAPSDDLERRLILEWVGERLTWLGAREAGLRSEKQFWVDKINKIYDPQVNKVVRGASFMRSRYTPVAQAYLDEVRVNFLAGQKNSAKPKEAPKSVKVGLLMCQYTKDRASIQIVDEALAIVTLTKLKVKEAIKTVVSVLKSGIPDPIKLKLPEDQKDLNGLFFYPGGKEKFDFK